MSFKYHAQQVGPSKYVLPVTGTMRCEVTAFLSEELYAATDEQTWQQAYNSASVAGASAMYLMPDCHFGFGIPIGGVLVTDDTIIPMASGYDISCGVLYIKIVGLGAKRVRSWNRRLEWVREVERRVALGLGSHRPDLAAKVDRHLIEDVLRYGAKALDVAPGLCERPYIPVPRLSIA